MPEDKPKEEEKTETRIRAKCPSYCPRLDRSMIGPSGKPNCPYLKKGGKVADCSYVKKAPEVAKRLKAKADASAGS